MSPSKETVASKAAANGDPENTEFETAASTSAASKTSSTAHYKFGDIEPMVTIAKSPYEPNQSAEIDEPLFERMKLLLKSKEELESELQDLDGKPTLTVQQETVDLFGETLAESLVKAYHVIGKSGILFSPPWLEDKQCKIRGVQCGWISRPMMLLLLQEQRFTRANDVVLANLIQTLGVARIFFDALREWKLDKHSPKLMSNAPSLNFTGKKRECLKSVIFIARAYRCAKLLKRGVAVQFKEEEPVLFAKIEACMAILNEYVKVNPKRYQEFQDAREAKRQKAEAKRRRKALIEAANRDNQRRQQERHQQVAEMLGNSSIDAISISSSNDLEPSYRQEDSNHVVRPSKVPSSAATSRPSSGQLQDFRRRQAERQESLEVLLKIAEKQHRILGETIQVLKHKIQSDREETKEELRQEVLAELGGRALKNGSRKY